MTKNEIQDKIHSYNVVINAINSCINILECEKADWISKKNELEETLKVHELSEETCSQSDCQFIGFKGQCIKGAFGLTKDKWPKNCAYYWFPELTGDE